MARENTMALFREGDTGRKLREQTKVAIDPFIPKEHRGRLHSMLFLRCAFAQLEGVTFRAETLIPALATFAMAGILPDKSRHHGYLIPYNKIITPVFGYQGLVHLAYQAKSANGAVLLDVHSDLILEGDEYDDSLSLDDMVRSHRPRGERDPRKDPTERLRYAYAKFTYAAPVGGMVHTHERIQVMSPGELAAVRTGRGDGWKSFPYRMHQKAPIRRACHSGRVELAYMAGMALAAEGAGERGDVRAYSHAVLDMARAVGAETDSLQGAIGVVEATAHEQEDSALDRYLTDSSPIHAALQNPSCTLEQAEGHMARIRELLQHHGLELDEKAAGLYEAIKRDYARNE